MNRLALLGPIQISRDGEAVRGFESRKALALLCYLAVRAQPVSRVELANLFWGDKTEAQGRGNLSRVLNNLSSLFPNTFITDRESVQIKPDAFSLDIAEFEEQTTDERRKAEMDDAVRRLSSAVALYRGEFMAGLYLDDCPDFEIWLVQERERWQQRVVEVLDSLIRTYSGRREFSTALGFAARLLEIEPWREETHRDLMRLLARTGQRSAALQQYEIARRVLEKELSVEPSAETNALYAQIRAEEIAPPVAPPHNLPTHLTTFFGRETELTRITARLNNPDCRLLTLVGAGGIGKTRLAIEAGKNVLNTFRDGVYFVPLASIGAGQTEFIVPAIANALNLALAGQQEPKVQVLNFLRARQMLLLLDNFEHLLDAAQLVIEILQDASNVKILVTSREPLDAQAEWITRVAGLNYPMNVLQHAEELSHYSAVQLFAERAQRVDEQFALNPETAPHLIRLTQIVEGMPLALELAAARTRALTVNEIRAQVESNLDLLTTTMRDVNARHSSLRAVLDWSYGLLSKTEQKLFRGLSVFASGWTSEAAVQVCGGEGVETEHIAGMLNKLVDKSLVTQQEDAGEMRYRMLEPLRQYAREKLDELGESETPTARHLNFFMQLAEQASPQLSGSEQGQWFQRLHADHDNMRAALTWRARELEGSVQRLRLAAALSHYWQVRGNFAEGQSFLSSALDQSEPTATPARARAFLGLGTIGWLRGAYDQASAWHEQALALYRDLGDTRGIIMALYNIGVPYFYRGEFEKARLLFEESLTLARRQHDKQWIGLLSNTLGELARYQGDYPRAQALIEQAHALALETQHIQHIGLTLNNLGLLATRQGDYARAVRLHRDALELYRTGGEMRLVPECVDGLAAALTELGQSEKAARLMGAADAFRESIGLLITPIDRPDYERVLACVRQDMHEGFQTVWAKGRALTLEQAIEYALTTEESATQTAEVSKTSAV